MVMPVGPLKFSCYACGWSKVIHQRTDVIMGPGSCPQCGCRLSLAKAGWMDRIKSLGGIRPFGSGRRL